MYEQAKKPEHGTGKATGEGKPADKTDDATKQDDTAATGAISIFNQFIGKTAKQNRSKLGVNEAVEFSVEGTEGAFSSDAGTGTSKNDNGTTVYTWTAPAKANPSITITFKPKGGGKSVTTTVSVTEPADIKFSKGTPFAVGSPVGAGMDLNVDFTPLDVCFGNNIEWVEDDVPATNLKGFFALKDVKAKTPSHVAANPPPGINNDNHAGDHASAEWSQNPSEDGSFDWVIPSSWRVKGGAKHKIRDITQTTTMTSKGVTTVTKDGVPFSA